MATAADILNELSAVMSAPPVIPPTQEELNNAPSDYPVCIVTRTLHQTTLSLISEGARFANQTSGHLPDGKPFQILISGRDVQHQVSGRRYSEIQEVGIPARLTDEDWDYIRSRLMPEKVN